MKILALGDPHGYLPKNLDRIIKKEKIDLIINIGDSGAVPKNAFDPKSWNAEFTKKCNESFEYVVDKICSYGLPVILLQGNMHTTKEGMKVARRIWAKHDNIIRGKTRKVRVKGKTFILFDMIFEEHYIRSESTRRRYLHTNKGREKHLHKMLKKNSDAIVLSHAPPYKCLDKTHLGEHIGSKILLNAIKKFQPKLFLCGHVHEDPGMKKLGKTEVHNLGGMGMYKVFEV